MKTSLLVFLLSIVLIGCSNNMQLKTAINDAQDPHVIQDFENRYRVVVDAIKANPNFKRIPLDDKDDQDWFNTQAFLLWDKKKSKQEFISEGVARFPGYQESFEFVAIEFME